MRHRITRLPLVLSAIGACLLLGLGASLALGTTVNKTDAVRSGLDGHTPKNVIYFLGDGMGTQEITALRYYLGAKNPLNVDRMPYTGFDTTYSVKPGSTDATQDLPDYVPDSAATGTEWATGKKTIDDRISQSPSSAVNVPGTNDGYQTVLEQAKAAGKKVGDVTTADVTDATPAVLAAHISQRGCEGPGDMTPCASERKSAGGLGSIAEQEVDHGVDVLFGGGYNRFAATNAAGAAQTISGGPDDGRSVLDSATRQGYQLLRTSGDLASFTDPSKKALGLFNQDNANGQNMALEFNGPKATLGAGSPATAARCTENARPSSEPSLPDMTQKAIDLLKGTDKGFFLQVEGASIDKQDHAVNVCGQIGETKAFDDAIGKALDFQAANPDTLIVVTADHAHTSEIVPEDATGSSLPTGYSGNVLTRDGQTLRLTYGTSGYAGAGTAPVADAPSQQHTGSVVPVWASGPQGTNILGTNDHTGLFDLLRGAKDEQAGAGTPTTTVTGPTTTLPGATVTTPGTTVTSTVTAPGGTVTVPGPATTTPDVRARLGVAAVRRITRAALRSPGLPVAVTSLNVKTIAVKLKRGGRTVASKSLRTSGTTSLEVRSAKKGSYKLSVTGGRITRTATITVR